MARQPLYLRREQAMAELRAREHAPEIRLKKHNQQNKSPLDLLRNALRSRQGIQRLQESGENQPALKALLLYLDELSAARQETLWTIAGMLVRHCPALLLEADGLTALMRFDRFRKEMLRPIDTWKPRGKRNADLLQQLQRHLFEQYPTPACIEAAFWDENEAYASWYLDWTRGKSPRTFLQVPFMQITPKMIHLLQSAPRYLPVREALRWAQASGMGLISWRATAIAEAFRLVDELLIASGADLHTWSEMPEQHPEAFAESLVQFFANHPELHREDYGPVVDYVFSNKYICHQAGPQRVRVELLNEKFTLKGRTAASLIREVNNWHRQVATSNLYKQLPLLWKRVAIDGFEWDEGVGEKRCTYTIRQLNTQKALFEEGARLNHCVASYIGRCVNGQCSIWTFEVAKTGGVKEKLLTIELRSDNTIVQVRGKNNRLPTPPEKHIVRLWTARNHLKML